MKTRVAIVGVSGFSGAELVRILEADDRFEVTATYSDRLAAASGTRSGRAVRPQADAVNAGKEAQIVALATPAEVSAELAPKLLSDGARVIDLSGAFRLTDSDLFAEYYRFQHPHPELLASAHYGLPQVAASAGAAPPIEEARLVANPGCYATAAIVALAPFVGRLSAIGQSIVAMVDGKSGVTGAGRKLAERYLFTEVAENVSLYRVVDHQHVPEIELALSRVAKGRAVRITFAPHLLPVKRGLITTCFLPVDEGGADGDPRGVLEAFYGGSDVIRVCGVDEVDLQAVALSPYARVGAKLDARSGTVVTACAIDNLLKGAASQAHENLVRMVSRPAL